MKLTKLIKKQVGNGHKKYCKFAFGSTAYDDWCAALVWWCLKHCDEKFKYMKKADNPFYVPNIEAWAIEHNRTIKKSKAKRGDIVTFDWDGNGVGNHTGIFWSGDPDGCFKTIEGNTGKGKGKVLIKKRYASQVNYVIRLKKEKEKK